METPGKVVQLEEARTSEEEEEERGKRKGGGGAEQEPVRLQMPFICSYSATVIVFRIKHKAPGLVQDAV